jgi:2-succinyl-6-hydroxy-2,4-cyclohexadiene-1-carboxylate synthase
VPGTEATSDRLALRATGHGDRVVVFLHGFAQTGGCGGPLVEDLARDHTVLLPDAPGHGGSARHADADLWATADLVHATVRAAASDRSQVDAVGYSMGARTALHLALSHPGAVRSLVLIGGTAGIEDPVAREDRHRADRALADRIGTIGVGPFLDEWLDQPMFRGLPAWARFDEERRTNTAGGLAASLRRCGTGSMTPLWDRLDGIVAPTLCLAGSADTKFLALADRMADAMGADASAVPVDGAGHAAHLERPTEVIDLVRAHLSRTSTG